ncbi:hypothetical protein EJ07DRAFT_152211 [Lizonia empirigonia]|nr:hypothetical protein EJ07DRAFT_152211 [Lizonia empirigonia]
MPPQAHSPKPRTAKPAPTRSPLSKPTPKRSRTDGTQSSPHVIESDGEDELGLPAPKKAALRKDRKPPGPLRILAAQPILHDPGSFGHEHLSSDEPSITRVQARDTRVVKDAAPVAPSIISTRLERSSPCAAPANSASHPPRSAPLHPPHDSRRVVGAFSTPSRTPAPVETPSPFSPFSQTSFPLYGEHTNLKSAFESVSKNSTSTLFATPAPRCSNAAASGSIGKFAPGIGPERTNLSSGLKGLSHDCTPSATSQAKPFNLADQTRKLEDPFSSPPQSAFGRVAQAPDHPFANRTSKKRKSSLSAKKSSTNAIAFTPANPISSVRPTTPIPSPFTSNNKPTSSIRRRVPTPDRLFTNMSISNINELILAMPRVEAEEARRRAKKKKKTQTVASLQGRSAKKAGPPRKHGSIKRMETNANGSVEAGKQHENIEMTDDDDDDGAGLGVQMQDMPGDDDLDLIDAEGGSEEAEDKCSIGIETLAGVEAGNESDNTLADFEDELAVSPTGAKTKRMNDKISLSKVQVWLDSMPVANSLLPVKSSNAAKTLSQSKAPVQTSTIDRAARATPASSIIGLTDDEPYASAPPQEKRRSGPTVTASVTASALLQPAAASSAPCERPEHTKTRKAEFMQGFKAKYGIGGFSIRDAILEVNAGKRLSVTRFNQEEGERYLRSLADQGKLAIRHELVYNLEQDPGPNAPPPHPVKKRKSTTATQGIKKKA